MGFSIIPGRNSGYPCIPELPDITQNAGFAPPFPERIFIVSGDSYPRPAKLPAEEKAVMSAPYPARIMRCVSGNYPAIAQPQRTLVFCRLFAGGGQIAAMYFGGKKVTAAYFNGEEVYRIYVV